MRCCARCRTVPCLALRCVAVPWQGAKKKEVIFCPPVAAANTHDLLDDNPDCLVSIAEDESTLSDVANRYKCTITCVKAMPRRAKTAKRLQELKIGLEMGMMASSSCLEEDASQRAKKLFPGHAPAVVSVGTHIFMGLCRTNRTVTGLVGQIVPLHVATCQPSFCFSPLLSRRQPLAVVYCCPAPSPSIATNRSGDTLSYFFCCCGHDDRAPLVV